MTARVILSQLLLGATVVSPTVVAALFGQTPAAPSVSGPAGAYSATQTLSAPGPVPLPFPLTGPAGVYTVNAPVEATISETPSSVTISWGNGPSPPGPVPPPPPGPTPPLPPGPPVSTFQQLGRDYAAMLAADLAAGFNAGADKLDAGAKVADANAALRAAWDAARKQSFATKVGTELAKIVPEKTEPDATTRPKFSQAWRDFAKGLQGK